MSGRTGSGSLWAATARRAPETRPLQGDAAADVAVIGGGFCGLSCALHLAEGGADTVLVEAEGPGWGASGRNGGQVIPCFKDDPETLVARLGPDLGERMSALGASGGALVGDLIARFGIDCGFRRDGWIFGLHAEAWRPALQARARQWQERGRPVRVLARDETAALLGTDLYVGGYLDPEGGALNPLSFARGLAAAAISRGARVHTGTPATAIEREARGGWRIVTARGSVRAASVVVATGAYSGALLPVLRRSVLPVQSIQVATGPLSDTMRRRVLPEGHVVSDTRRLLLYFRQDDAGRLVFGGRGALGGERMSPAHVARVTQAMHRTFPGLGEVEIQHSWAGQVDITADRRLRVHELAPGLIAVLGFNGRGVAIAPAVGKALAEAVLAGSLDALPLPVTPARPVPFHRLRRPAMAAAVQWSRLLDRIGSR